MEHEVKVRSLILDPTNNSPIVILKDVSSDAMLPIWIGVYEANAIAMEIEKAVAQRPLTHDLLKSVIDQLGAIVERVIINDLNKRNSHKCHQQKDTWNNKEEKTQCRHDSKRYTY